MFDQSPHWGLRTVFPSVLGLPFIRAKLVMFEGGRIPRCAKDSPSSRSGHTDEASGEAGWQLEGSHLCLTMSLFSLPQFSILPSSSL